MSERRLILKNRLLLSLLVLVLCLSACYNGDVQTSGDASPEQSIESSEQESSYESEEQYNRAEIARLLLNDKLVHMIFAGGYLTGGETTSDYVEVTGEYADFAAISALLESTYDSTCGVIDYYLGFPEYGKNAVIEGDGGKTYCYYHYIDDRDIAYSNFVIGDDNVTVGDITLPLVQTDDGVRLGGTLYSERQYVSPKSEKMDVGSAKKLGGRYLAVVILMSQNDYVLSDGEERAFNSSVDGAIKLVSDISKQYGVQTSFDVAVMRFVHSESVDGDFELDMMLAGTSFRTLEGLITSQCDTEEYDGYFAVCCSIDVTGVAYTAYYDGLPDTNWCERLIVGTDADAKDIAAAVFGICGAEQRGDDKTIAEYFGIDIMDGGDGLSDLNAYRVGLTEQIDSQLGSFIRQQTE